MPESTGSRLAALAGLAVMLPCLAMAAAQLDKISIEKAAGTPATVQGDTVRIGWTRDDVAVRVDGEPFPPAAGLGSWAAFKPTGDGDQALVMGDTVVFQDEVDAAMDAAFAHGLAVTALHNHFFYDEPKVYFMHIGGKGPATELATGVRAVWDAIRQVRSSRAQPSDRFAGPRRGQTGTMDAQKIKDATGLEPAKSPGGVLKISAGREASMNGTPVGASMGLTSWAAFSGTDALSTIDGDFIMAAGEVQPVLMALRKAGLHIVALHNHMIGEEPSYYFTHFWGTGPVADLARGFKAALRALEVDPKSGTGGR